MYWVLLYQFRGDWELCVPEFPSLYGSRFGLDKIGADSSEEAHNLGSLWLWEDSVTESHSGVHLSPAAVHLSTVSTNQQQPRVNHQCVPRW